MTDREAVLAALSEELALTSSQLGEELGLDIQQVADALHELKVAGEAKRVPEGWVRVVAPPADRPPVIVPAPPAEEPKQETAMPRPKKTAAKKAVEQPRQKRKYTRRVVAAPSQPAANAPAGKGVLAFALTERREIAIDRCDGSGERSLIGAADALRLAEFIALVRPALES